MASESAERKSAVERQFVEGTFGESQRIAQMRRKLDKALLAVVKSREGLDGIVGLDVDTPLVRAGIRRRSDYGDSTILSILSRSKAFPSGSSKGAKVCCSDQIELLPAHVEGFHETARSLVQALIKSGLCRTLHTDVDVEVIDTTLDARGRELMGESRRAKDIACRILPILGPDLFFHAPVFVWVHVSAEGPSVLSGTVVDLPGVILLSDALAGDRLTLAEALIHEASHSKFYDICVTRDILSLDGSDVSYFDIPWRASLIRGLGTWPTDQVMAAAHAYVHLAVLGYKGAIASLKGVDTTRWEEIRSTSVYRATVLLKMLRGASENQMGKEGRSFVDWLWHLLQQLAVDEDLTDPSFRPYVAGCSEDSGSMRGMNPERTLSLQVKESSLESYWVARGSRGEE